MPGTYSEDLRRSIITYVGKGHSRRETARVFDVSYSFVIELMRRHTAGEAGARPRGGARNIKLIPYLDDIISWITEKPDMTLPMMVARLHEVHAVKASDAGVSSLLRRNGYTYKKNRCWRARQHAASIARSVNTG